MVCPYCSTRNIPTATICSQCGAILRDSVTIRAKAQKRSTYTPPRQSIIGRLIALVGAAIVAGIVGFLLGRIAFEDQRDLQIAVAVGAALAGALIVYLVTFGRVAILRFVYTRNRNRAQNKIRTLLADAQKRLEDSIEENPDVPKHPAPYVRDDLGTVFLLKDDIEDSLQQFAQAHHLQLPRRAEDMNNNAVAFARHGQIKPAQEFLEKALLLNPKSVPARFNLARMLNQPDGKKRPNARKKNCAKSTA